MPLQTESSSKISAFTFVQYVNYLLGRPICHIKYALGWFNQRVYGNLISVMWCSVLLVVYGGYS